MVVTERVVMSKQSLDGSGVFYGFLLGVSCVLALKHTKLKALLTIFRRPRQMAVTMDPRDDYKMVLVVRTDLNMSKGKIAAQCCHAALGSYKKAEAMTPQYVEKWAARGQPKIVLKLGNDEDEKTLYELVEIAKGLDVACTVIHDAGHTQVKSGTATCAGFGPAPVRILDSITGHLKLL